MSTINNPNPPNYLHGNSLIVNTEIIESNSANRESDTCIKLLCRENKLPSININNIDYALTGTFFSQDRTVERRGNISGNQSLLSGRGTKIIPANILKEGNIIDFKFYGRKSSIGAHTPIKFELKFGDKLIGSITSVEPQQTEYVWKIDGTITLISDAEMFLDGTYISENKTMFFLGDYITIDNSVDSILDLYINIDGNEYLDLVSCTSGFMMLTGV